MLLEVRFYHYRFRFIDSLNFFAAPMDDILEKEEENQSSR